MFRSLQYSIVFTVLATVAIGLLGGGLWTYFTPFYLFVLVPTLDHFGGLDTNNPDADQQPHARYFNFWLYLWVPAQVAILIWVLWHVTHNDLATYEVIGLTISVGMMASGGGINIAHEFMHRKNSFQRAMAEILMTSVSYSHFCVEHVLGHHKHVGTPQDPATARKNENIYLFLPRTLWGGLVSAWRLETDRVRNRKLTWTLKDRRVRYTFVYGLLIAAIFFNFGLLGVGVFVGQSMMAVLLLEVINYVEHYGLSRKQLENGRYERVLPKHSWNSAHRLTNALLVNLPRHADHHYMASRPYQQLRHIEESPQLPTGYAAMVLLALMPPLWKKVMNPKVDAWNQRVLQTDLVAP